MPGKMRLSDGLKRLGRAAADLKDGVVD